MARTRAFDENEVLEAIEQEFRNSGYAATSLDDIMRASGLGKGSLYGAFGGKRELFLRSFDSYCSSVTRGLARKLRGPDETALSRLEATLLDSARATDDAAVPRACFLAKSTAELAARDDEVAAKAREAFAALARSFTACIRQAQLVGDIDRGADPVALGNFALSVFRGNEALAEAGAGTQVLLDAAAIAISALTSHGPLPETGSRKD